MDTGTTRILRAVTLAAVLALSVGACAAPWGTGSKAPEPPRLNAPLGSSSSTGTAPGSTPGGSAGANPADGIVASAESPAEPSEARNIRLVRNGPDELALQFEFHNGSAQTTSPYRWADVKARMFLLFDLPRGTTYQVLPETSSAGFKGTWGRLSGNWMDPVGPGQSTTLTAVFSAPPAEATSMTVAINDLLPVQVPIQPADSPGPKPDPILSDHHTAPNAGPLVCAAAQQNGPTQYRLPADVLFAFDSATLTPAAQTALGTLAKQVDGTSGTVTVAGNTDAIGGDAYNQTLSEQRAASVADALKQKLASHNFSYTAVGNGKTKPVAPNTNPDGSDNPDGRAQNRRVDIDVNAVGAAPQTSLEPGSDAARAGLLATVQSVRRIGGYLMTTTQITNPAAAPAAFVYNNTAVSTAGTGPRARTLFPGELAVLDPTGQHRDTLCIPGGNPNDFFSYAATMNHYTTIDAGQTLTLWGLTPAPSSDVTAVNVQIGGFPQPFPAQITAGP